MRFDPMAAMLMYLPLCGKPEPLPAAYSPLPAAYVSTLLAAATAVFLLFLEALFRGVRAKRHFVPALQTARG
jgi:hypothetical protein